MTKRALAMTALAVAAILLLAGCSSKPASGLTRAQAQAQVAQFLHTAETAIGSPVPSHHTTLETFENCHTDDSYFATTSEWRSIVEIRVPKRQQGAAARAVAAALGFGDGGGGSALGETYIIASAGSGAPSLQIESAGASDLYLIAISGCYG